MIQTVEDFDEATLFERLALDRVRPVLGDESTDEIDLRSPDRQGGVIVHVRLHCSVSGDAVNSVAAALTPLLFGAAWKILDLFVELALNLSGAKPKSDNWSIKEKVKAAQGGMGLSSLLTDDAALSRAILCTYAATHQHRHCVVHRTAQFSSQTVQLAGVDKDGTALRPLTKTELDAFLVIAQEVASAVIAGGLEPRSADYLRFELDQLREHTGLSDLGGKRRSKPVMVRMVPTPLGGELYELDFKAAYERAVKVRPQSHYDVWIDCPDDSGRILFARLEDVPIKTVRFKLEAPPAFLQFR
jgi:hypothetical protein